jgi:hypothetical protein
VQQLGLALLDENPQRQQMMILAASLQPGDDAARKPESVYWGIVARAQAQVIEINADAVDAAIGAVRAALAQGHSWADLDRLIKVPPRLIWHPCSHAHSPPDPLAEQLMILAGAYNPLISRR